MAQRELPIFTFLMENLFLVNFNFIHETTEGSLTFIVAVVLLFDNCAEETLHIEFAFLIGVLFKDALPFLLGENEAGEIEFPHDIAKLLGPHFLVPADVDIECLLEVDELVPQNEVHLLSEVGAECHVALVDRLEVEGLEEDVVLRHQLHKTVDL